MKSSRIHDYYKVITVLGIGFFVLASALVIFFVSRAGGEGEDNFAFDTVDSSSCVACHTNEGIIAASNWGEGVEEAEDTGG